MVAELQKDRPEKRVQKVPISESTNSADEKRMTLAELGLDKRAAAQARKLAKYTPNEFETRLKKKMDKLELSRTSTLEDSKPKKEPEASRHFFGLLKDFQEHPDDYDAESFAGDQKLVALYQRIRGKFVDFINAFDANVEQSI